MSVTQLTVYRNALIRQLEDLGPESIHYATIVMALLEVEDRLSLEGYRNGPP